MLGRGRYALYMSVLVLAMLAFSEYTKLWL